MKPLKQTKDFLENTPVRSENDWVLIKSFCEQKYDNAFTFTPSFDETKGIGCLEFVEWFNHAYSNGDIVVHTGNPCIVFESSMDSVTIAIRFVDSDIIQNKEDISAGEVVPANDSVIHEVRYALFKEGLQYFPETGNLIERYIPLPGSRVVFTSNEGKIYGVVRELNLDNGTISLYCYWNSNTGQAFHSMHESVHVDPSVEFAIMSAGMYRRLKNELGKLGFDWNDKVGRVEPLKGKVAKGKPYFFISDKIKVCKAIEKESRISHERWLAGNYFWTIDEALEAQGDVIEYLRDKLATTKRGD